MNIGCRLRLTEAYRAPGVTVVEHHGLKAPRQPDASAAH